MHPHYIIKGSSQAVTGVPPGADLMEKEHSATTQLGWVKILMGDSVPPDVQRLQRDLAVRVTGVFCIDKIPETQPEPIKVGTNVTGVRVTRVEPAVQFELDAENPLEAGRRNCPHQMI